MQYFGRFTRFEAKWFIADAIAFFGGATDRCVVDNTSVLLVSGSGSEAVFAPELVAFADCYGMTFMAHEVRDPDRNDSASYCTSFGLWREFWNTGAGSGKRLVLLGRVVFLKASTPTFLDDESQ